MVRAGDLRAICTVLLGLSGGAAVAAQPATRAFVDRLHNTERTVATAIDAGDRGTLSRQSTAAFNLMPTLSDDENEDVYGHCRMAVSALANLVEDVTGLPPLRSRVAFSRDWQLYIEHVGPCERAVGAQPPAAPNLR